MTEYKYSKELNEFASKTAENFRQSGIDADVLDDSLREFSIKISVSKDGASYGNCVIYYSPNKNQFSLKTHELSDKAIIPELESVFNGEFNFSNSIKNSDKKLPGRLKGYHAYVDGAFIYESIGLGAVILNEGEIKKEISIKIDREELKAHRQIAGEIFAVMEALKWCMENGVKELSIHYDYNGIEKWAVREWKTKHRFIEEYINFVNSCNIAIRWIKVKSHSGDKWNEYVDNLAKKGAEK